MFTLYVDDSGTSPTDPVAVAAAWMGPFRRWLRFETEWKAAMKKERFTCFHAAECVFGNSKSEFADWDYEKKKRVFKRLRQVTRKYATCGWAFAIHKDVFDKVVTPDIREVIGQYHYTFAIRALFGAIEEYRQQHNIEQKFEYVFDWINKNDPRRREIEWVLEQAQRTPTALNDFGVHEGCFSFRKRCDVVPLQAADLLAWSHFARTQEEFVHRKPHPLAAETWNEFLAYDKCQWADLRIFEKDGLAAWIRHAKETGMIQDYALRQKAAGLRHL